MTKKGERELVDQGAAIGDRAALWHGLAAQGLAGPDYLGEPWNPWHSAIPEDLQVHADAAVSGMFRMVANHLQSDSAARAFAPLQLLVLLRGVALKPESWVQAIGDDGGEHLMVISPGLFINLADRFLRLWTCGEIQPGVGDPTSCLTVWREAPLANQPADAERFDLAMGMAMMAALVVFYHELAHILRGHSAYLARDVEDNRLGVLREFEAPTHKTGGNRERRALEVDADLYAGVFLARVVKEQGIFAALFSGEALLCWAVALVAGVTFNAFEAAAASAGYREGYHLPGTRMECFLEGFAQEMGITDKEPFLAGAHQAFVFCERHYQAVGSQEEIERDIDDLEHVTWPLMVALRSRFLAYVPRPWLARV